MLMHTHDLGLFACIPAERLVRNTNFQVYLKMYCQGIKFGCPNAALLGIRACGLVHPNITLPDGTKYTYVYFISCQREVTKKGTGQLALNMPVCQLHAGTPKPLDCISISVLQLHAPDQCHTIVCQDRHMIWGGAHVHLTC